LERRRKKKHFNADSLRNQGMQRTLEESKTLIIITKINGMEWN
jgi:hypothetical protein